MNSLKSSKRGTYRISDRCRTFYVTTRFRSRARGSTCRRLLITLLVTAILVIGIRESATTNAVLVAVKVGVVLFVICAGSSLLIRRTGPACRRLTASSPKTLTTIPDLAAAAVKSEAMPTKEAEKRIDAITGQVRSLYVEKAKLTPAEGRERINEVKRQIKSLYDETARAAGKGGRCADSAAYRGGPRSQSRRAQAEGTAERSGRGRHQRGRPRRRVGETQGILGSIENTGDGKGIGRAIKNHQLNQTQAEDLLKQAKKEDAYLPADPNEEALAKRLLVKVEKEAPHNATAKWGMLGYLGLDSYLESIDDRIRSPFMPYGLAGVIFGASIVFFAYIGFDAVSTHSEEAKKPQRDVPVCHSRVADCLHDSLHRRIVRADRHDSLLPDQSRRGCGQRFHRQGPGTE